ncbi:MAG: hypothetical protein WC372_10985 [Candidatus Neomarinimicrobiota bacterium]|jgi:hypothetical protein|nr:hypothetical protein [Candidatus Neomarinimicrobiota bacterium]MDD5011160.1 hypothetical protein [Phycisphaerae bacterium]
MVALKDGKMLTQAGLNRVLWKLLHAVGGKFSISTRNLNNFEQDKAIKIDYDIGSDTFTLSLTRVKPEEESRIIVPRTG